MTEDPTNTATPEAPWHKPVRPPAEELLQLTKTLDRCIAGFLQTRNTAKFGHWEAPTEARALSNLMIRNLEAFLLMARTDEVLAGPAWTCARSVFEHAVRIIWLLYPDDPFDRECRWLGFLADTERSHKLVAEAMQNDPASPDGSHHRQRADAMRIFREGVTAKLPAGYTPQRPPSFEQMLRSIDSAQMYRFYREGSQFVHGSMWGTSLYRKNLGTDAEFGDFAHTIHWLLPLRLCWFSLRNAGQILLDRLQAPSYDWGRIEKEVDQDFQRLTEALSQSKFTTE
ncbi:DUF5677 domain-containing protein [Streptomyces sp. G2]|uniref:DUF5677 domain-containing protein n=1 Tax=Streptomyces sp. G2 TaxID=1684471 RepID=UPI00203077F4|nr:DUF5677 domain-containing protein [Streptomyces sp. G2]MCM1950376.1 DUF5677 domain-containing protein [Streptomyces sp. G2]